MLLGSILITGLIFFLVGMYAHHCIYRNEHTKAMERMAAATDKHNHYAERYWSEARRVFSEGVDQRTAAKIQSNDNDNRPGG